MIKTPTMRRQHFDYVAAVLKTAKPIEAALPASAELERWRLIVYDLGNSFEATNPSFSLQRFLDACGFFDKEQAK